MPFQQGLSGLNASSKSIDVISNNIANAGTVGFKSSQAHFADVFAASLQGTGASQVGIGVSQSSVFQQFTQGNVTATNNPLDLSINGAGLFQVSGSSGTSYTRNGQFHLDKAGFIVNDQQFRLAGFPVDPTSGTIVASTPSDLQIPAAQIPPRATSDLLSGDVEAVLNLDSREPAIDQTVTAFDPVNPQTYTFSTGLQVYDTLGNSHSLTTYYVKTGPGAWNAYATLDNANPDGQPATPTLATPLTPFATLNFDNRGALVTPPAQPIDLPSFTLTNGAAPLAFNAATAPSWQINYTGTSQFGADSSVDRLAQGGFTSGSLAGISVGDDGVIQGRYTNGQTRNLGQVALIDFTNLNGLRPIGDNLWAETSDSGPPLVGAPNSGGLGVLNSSAIEESNVDLTAELVAMITQQRNYQANAQSIKTQDQILNTLVNLR